MKTITIAEIIEGCGGDLAVAYRLNVHQQTVRRWVKNYDLPEKYWFQLAELFRPEGTLTYADIRTAQAAADFRDVAENE